MVRVMVAVQQGVICTGSETTPCFVQPCPVNCAYDPTWTCWTPCSAPCGGGSRFRQRLVVIPSLFNGTLCDESDILQTETCNNFTCATECHITGEWTAWSTCSRSCGTGTRTRSRTFEIVNSTRGPPDTVCDETVQEQFCNKKPCPFDCIVSMWSHWSECSGPCYAGYRTRKRTILAMPMFDGQPCGNLTEMQSCISPACTSLNQLTLLCDNVPKNSYQPIGRCPVKYVYCPAVGSPRVMTCPQSQAFSVEKQICVPQNMLRGCLPSTGNFCAGKPNGAYPSCTCCTDYILCWQGTAKYMRCGLNEVFQQYPYGSCVPRSEHFCPNKQDSMQ